MDGRFGEQSCPVRGAGETGYLAVVSAGWVCQNGRRSQTFGRKGQLMRCDVLIIGGGIVGCALARELSRYRLRVVLCEQEAEVGFGTSKANSGILHGGHHASLGTLKGELEWAGNQLWDALAVELGFGVRRVGELTVAQQAEQLSVLDTLLHHARVRQIPGVERWSAAQVQAAEPALASTVLAALYAPTTGVVNPYEACYALAANAVRNGVELRTLAPVQQLDLQEEGWVVTLPQARLVSRFVVNAAGLWADRVAELAGVRTFSIHPRKGEEYLLDKRLQGLVRHVIFPCPSPLSKGILIIPTYDGTLMVGPTAEAVEDRADLSTSAAGARSVFAAVRQLLPGISEQDVIAQFAGVRAPADGEDFVIGPTARRGFLNAAGIQSPGLTAAPAIARLLADLLREEGLALVPRQEFVAVEPPRVRFAALSPLEQVELTRQNPRYRRIVCRCEQVTEGEVLDAAEQGATTLDGIKFRTRAGMGRCQGAFCTARCLELLARARRLPLTALTKRGPGSWLVCDRPGPTVSDFEKAGSP